MAAPDPNFIEEFFVRMSKNPMVGPQGAVNLKLDAWVVVLRYFLVQKGVVSAEEFDSFLKRQLDDFEKMVSDERFKTVSPIQKKDMEK